MDGHSKQLKKVNRELNKPTGGTFSLDEKEYREFVEEYYEYVHDHEDFETFIKYKEGQSADQIVNFFASENEEFNHILDDVHDKILDLCDINDVLN